LKAETMKTPKEFQDVLYILQSNTTKLKGTTIVVFFFFFVGR
jgi:hypothetical protein